MVEFGRSQLSKFFLKNTIRSFEKPPFQVGLNFLSGVIHFTLHRMNVDYKIDAAVAAQACSHLLAQAVYHCNFRHRPVTTGGRDIFIELDSLQLFLFEVTGELQELILASPQVPP